MFHRIVDRTSRLFLHSHRFSVRNVRRSILLFRGVNDNILHQTKFQCYTTDKINVTDAKERVLSFLSKNEIEQLKNFLKQLEEETAFNAIKTALSHLIHSDDRITTHKLFLTLKYHDLSFFIRVLDSLVSRGQLSVIINLLESMPSKEEFKEPINHWIDILISKNDNDDVMRLFNYLEPQNLITTQTFKKVLKYFLDLNKYQVANELFKRMRSSPNYLVDYSCFNLFIQQAIRNKKMIVARRFFDDMLSNHIMPDKNTLKYLIIGNIMEKNVEEMENVFNKCYRLGVKPEVVHFDLIIPFLVREGHIDKAKEWLQDMRDLDLLPNVRIIVSLMKGFLSAGRTKEGDEMYNELLKLEKTIDDYALVIDQMFKSNKVEEAMKFFEMMKKEGKQPTTTIYKIMILGLVQANMPNQSSSILIEFCKSPLFKMIDLNLILDHVLKENLIAGVGLYTTAQLSASIQLDAHSYFNLISAYIANGHLGKVKQCIDEANQKGLDIRRYYQDFIYKLSNKGNTEYALELFRTLNMPNEYTYSAIILCLARNGDIDTAVELYREMKQKKLHPSKSVCTKLISEFGKLSNLKMMQIIYSDLKKHKFVDITAHNVYLKNLLEIGEVDEAMKVFKEICAKGFKPNINTYHTMIPRLMDLQKLEEMKFVHDKIMNLK